MILYVSEPLLFKRRPDLEDNTTECIWGEINVNHKSILVGSFYRSPSQMPALRNQFMSSLNDMLDNALSAKPDSIIFGGDFNSRSKYWWVDDINTVEGSKLYDVTTAHAFGELIHEPTRITPVSKSCLDLLFTNTPGYVLDAKVEAPIFGSDHSIVIATVDSKKTS
jgi:endonuclease/exonuclease/phosphatase (EEP) superfamily protein YafD